MTILIDSRVGSRDLVELLPDNMASLTTLESADVAFIGHGPNGAVWPIGVEIKTISDALDSFHSGRFCGGQLPSLTDNYRIVYLLIEGLYRATNAGFIQLGRFFNSDERNLTWRATLDTQTRYSSFDNWLNSIAEIPKVRIKRSNDREDTARQILNLFNRWQKPWEDHMSAFSAYEERWKPAYVDESGAIQLREPTFEERVAKQLPRVGKTKAEAVAAHFSTVEQMVNAGEEEWLQIPGVGKKIASEIWKKFRGL